MKYLATIILASFLGVALLGFSASLNGTNQDFNNCIVSTFDKTTCSDSAISMAIKHINAYHAFSHLTLAGMAGFASSLFLFMVLAITLVFFRFLVPVFSILPFAARLRQSEGEDDRQSIRLMQWLALHENSPSRLTSLKS